MTQAYQLDTGDLASGVYFFEPQVGTESADDIERVVQLLKGVSGTHSLHAALQAGHVIFEQVFMGDERMLRARGKKCSSFRKLASHPRLGMSPSSLWRAVAIFELSRRFPELQEYVHTGVGHISVILGLQASDQFKLLRQCETERWTRRHLQHVVAELRTAQRADVRMPTSRVLERLRGLEMLLADTQRDDRIWGLEADEARQALLLLERIRVRFGDVTNKVNEQLPNEMATPPVVNDTGSAYSDS